MNEPSSPSSDQTRTVLPVDSNATGAYVARASETHTVAPRESAPIGSTIPDLPPNYEFLRELGRGGMGVVYLARDTKLNRIVALKMILAGSHAAPSEMQRFLKEAEAVAAMQHVNIVQIFETGQHLGLPYFTLEFVDGGTLAALVRDHPLAPKEAARIVEQLAHGIAYAHGKGIAHRDLKPENVLLAACGLADERVPKITDFGLAKRFDLPAVYASGSSEPMSSPEPERQGTALTHTGAVMGTPSYMAPEQAAGNKVIGPPADVYALGAILYRLITGRPPFQATTPLDTILQVVSDDPVAPRSLQPNLPQDLETICLKCLHKEPAKRYAGAQDLADDLRRFLNGEPIVARPIGIVERGLKWSRRRPALASLLAVTIIAAAVLAVVILDSNVRLKHERNHARNMEGKATDEKNSAIAATAEADRQRIRAQELLSHTGAERGRRLLEGGNHLGLLELLEARRAAEDLRQLRNAQTVLWAGWAAACSGRLEQVLPNKSPVTAMAFGADGKTMATMEQNGDIAIWDLLKGEALLTIPTPKDLVPAPPFGAPSAREALAFAQDGKALTLRWWLGDGRGGSQAWDAASGRPLGPAVDLGRPNERVCLSPDGGWLVTCTGATLQRRDARTGKPVGPSWTASGPVESLVFSPDGKVVVTLGKQLEWWIAETGKVYAPPTAVPAGKAWPQDRNNLLAFSPNGKWLICRLPSFQNLTVRLHDVATGKLVGEPITTDALTEDVQVSPDGATLATLGAGLFGLNEARVQLWSTATGKAWAKLVGHEGAATSLAFSPDGKLLATGGIDGTARLWDVATALSHGPAFSHVGAVAAVAVAPTGGALATRDAAGTVRLWQTAVRPAHGKPVLETPAVGFAFGAGDKWLAVASEKQVQRWDLATFQPLGKPFQPDDAILSVACSPDGVLLANASEKGIQLWDVAANRTQGGLLPFPHTVAKMAFTQDGKALIAMSGDGIVQMWDSATGKVHDPPFKSDPVQAAFFDLQVSANAKLVAARCTFGLFLWRSDKGEQLPPSKDQLVLAMSSDGKILAGAFNENEFLAVKDPVTGQTVARLPEARFFVIPPEFSPDGQLVALPSLAQTVDLWDVTAGKPLGAPLVTRQQIQRLLFAPDGKILVIVSPNGTLRLFDITSRQQLGPPWGVVEGQTVVDVPMEIAFSANGRWLATLGADMILRVWPVPGAGIAFREMELRTWVSLGAETDAKGNWQPIPGEKWQALRRELRALEAEHH
jgi:serine/threonine protein kinase/WD40 repeat protein